MKLIKASRELNVKESDFILICRHGQKFIYGNTYWLMHNRSLFRDGTITAKGIEGIRLALEPLRTEFASSGDYEVFNNFVGTDLMTELNEENIATFQEYYETSDDPVMLEFLSTLTTLEGYNVAKLVVLLGLDTLLKVDKDLEELGEED